MPRNTRRSRRTARPRSRIDTDPLCLAASRSKSPARLDTPSGLAIVSGKGQLPRLPLFPKGNRLGHGERPLRIEQNQCP